MKLEFIADTVPQIVLKHAVYVSSLGSCQTRYFVLINIQQFNLSGQSRRILAEWCARYARLLAEDVDVLLKPSRRPSFVISNIWQMCHTHLNSEY